MSLRSPLSKILGRGSAKQGVSHWWVQRVTAIALIPLTLWFAYQLIHLPLADYDAVRRWVATGLNPAWLLIFIGAVAWHSSLGVQVVIEDYVPHKGAKVVALLTSTFLHVVLAVVSSYAVLYIVITNFCGGIIPVGFLYLH
ncbi:MAG: succinate dehydrogenase, hydrophobic membrane anchor protein [Gammaproteobacteria bacterium]|nr:succinate dehydrogenase, hydrophobic membrane anchor protein [Gammaproteobacteria bacterium]